LEWYQTSRKLVYILPRHSHFFMEDIFATPYWKHRGVLPGWIVGTAKQESGGGVGLPVSLFPTKHSRTVTLASTE
jgi:hypothetical protein